MHEPASSQLITTGDPHPYGMPAVAGPSGTTDTLLKVVLGLGLSTSQKRWYSLGILGYLLAPGAHSLHEVAMSVSMNAIAEYTPCYRYCGFLGFEMQQAPWYQPMLKSFSSCLRFGYFGDLDRLCFDLVRHVRLNSELWSLILSFLGLPFLPPDSWAPTLQEKYKRLG